MGRCTHLHLVFGIKISKEQYHVLQKTHELDSDYKDEILKFKKLDTPVHIVPVGDSCDDCVCYLFGMCQAHKVENCLPLSVIDASKEKEYTVEIKKRAKELLNMDNVKPQWFASVYHEV
jgi:hypothetical protein